ncbi:MAG: hypothetical protein OXJ52_03940 [Oligoflexia bacterium]|nr:hypothetical protein [Oligoflexia bacterium]
MNFPSSLFRLIPTAGTPAKACPRGNGDRDRNLIQTKIFKQDQSISYCRKQSCPPLYL